MTETPIPVARPEVIAAAADVALLTIRRRIASGRFPQADVRLPGRNERGWSLPAIANHDPVLAAKVKRIIVALEVGK